MERPSEAEIGFPEASTLVFENLPSFVSFASGDRIVKWPSLKDITVNICPKIKNFGLGHVDISQLKSIQVEPQSQEEVDPEVKVAQLFHLSDVFSSIEAYEIDDAELSKILAMKLKPSHFTNLVQLQAKNCDERLNDFLSVLLERSERLVLLTIKECKLLKHVFDLSGLVTQADREGKGQADREGKGKYFARLKTMQLQDLPQLNCIWNKDPAGLFGLGCLENIEIVKCGSLKNLISASAARNLEQLQVLKLHSCEMVEEVVATETQRSATQERVIEFPLLQELELMDLSKLINFHRGDCALEFPSLNILKIKNCPQMMSFVAGFASAEEQPIIDGRSFTKLSELELDTCGKLIYVIPSIMLPRLQNLKKLTVSDCDSLTEVIQFHGEFDSAVPMLPQLNELLLRKLPNLMHVISMKFASTKFFENLQILRVKDCNSLKLLFLPFVPDSPKLREIEISDCKALEEICVTKGKETSWKILFSHLNSVVLENLPKLFTFSLCTYEFPSLEKLEIKNCPLLKTFVPRVPEMDDQPAASNKFFENFGSLVNLRKLQIINQTGVDKLWHDKPPSKYFYKLEELTLTQSNNLLNIIPFSMLSGFNQLKSFTVEGCERLMEVFHLEDIPDDNDLQILDSLGEFALNRLPSLIHLWNKEPPVPIFMNLVSLQIMHCDGLTKLFSLSTAMHLRQLKSLKLFGCKKMEEVFRDEKEIQEEIVFEKIECLILKHLPSLVRFSGHSSTFHWPNLKIVRVCDIPKMETFSVGNQITPSLKTVYVTFIKKCWQGDLNSTIQYLNKPEAFREGRRGEVTIVEVEELGGGHRETP